MLANFYFGSLTREGYAYEIVKDENYNVNGYYANPGRYLSSHLVDYQTYGDGLTQHSHSSPVLVDHFVDALASLAKHLFENPTDVELVEKFWPTTESKKEVQFAMSLKYNKEKPTYYSFSELKTSRSNNKAYDKRWEIVPDWADGSIKTVFTLLMEKRTFYDALERFNLYLQIQEAFQEINLYEYLEGRGIGLNDRNNDTEYAFQAVNLLVQSFRDQKSAKRVFDCLEHNWLEPKLSKKEEE